MLKLIEGSLYSEASSVMRKEITEAIEEKKKVMLIVPEQQTVIAEKEMSKILPEYAPRFFEVTNFTRFSNTVFRLLGGIDKEYCDSVKSSLIMWRTLSELEPVLSFSSGRGGINYGMVKKALATSGELDGLALTTSELVEAMDKIDKDSLLSSKLDDLIKITGLYKKLIHEKYADVGEDVSAATNLIAKESDRFKDTLFFIEGFTSFTEPQYKLTELLLSIANVTILLDVPKSMSDSFEYSEILQTERRLISSANKRGVNVKPIKFDGIKNGNEDLYQLSGYLWKNNLQIDNFSLQNPDSLRIFEADTPYDACDFIVSDIKKKVTAGASYSDFAVIAGDISRYAGILDVSAKRAGVPLFISKARDASSFEAIKLLYTAISCVSGGFAREDLISYAKCGLSSINREDTDDFELYCEKWQITGKRFTDGVVWNMHPDGYSSFRTSESDAALVKINETRTALLTPLIALKERFDDASTVRDFATALYDFITSISLAEKINERARELHSLGEEEFAIENERIYKVICDALDTLETVSGAMKSDADGFLSQLKIVFSAVSVSKIPTYTDSVTAASAGIVRLTEKKHVYMLGVNRGEFPASISTDTYFTEKDKEILERAGLPFKPDALIKEAKELYAFTKVFSYAKSSLTILYSNKNADYSATRRAEVIDRIIRLTNNKITPVAISDIPESELVFTPAEALVSLGKFKDGEYDAVKQALINSGYAESVALAEKRVENDDLHLSPSVLSMIYSADIELSQSKIDSYNTCPLSYFCRYDLKLLENERAEFDARNIGSFIHAILENFFGAVVKDDKKLGELTASEKEDMITRSANEYLTRIMTDDKPHIRTEFLIKRLVNATIPIVDGLCEEFAGSSYVPRYFELRIGGRDELSPELFTITDGDGNRTLIKGSIDRVDTYKHGDDVFVRVVDYKTGHKEFKPEDLQNGKNLQMFLYLCAVVDTKNKKLLNDIGVGENGRLIPAGLIYVKSDLSDVKISHASAEEEEIQIKSDQKRQGMMLDDLTNVSAMNSKYLPVKLNNNGSYRKGSEKYLYTEDSWLTLRETVEESVRQVTKRMRSGDISAEPMLEKKHSPCNYCKFKPLCRNAKIRK